MTGPQGSTGPRGPAGFSGAPIATGSYGPGPQGATGASMPGAPVKHYPSQEGRMIASLDTEQGKVEVYSKASCSVPWALLMEADILLAIRDHDGVLVRLNRWGTKEVYERSPESLADSASALLASKYVETISKEELSALFVLARKEAFRSVLVLAAELHVGHMSREDMSQAWDDANALNIMTG